MSAINFDANQVAPDTGLSPVPKGRYKVMIIDSELKPTKSGNGEIIALSMQVIEGKFRGKSIKSNLNWRNPNITAQNIGHAQLSAICHAVNVITPQDTQQLHNIPLGLEVDVTPDNKYNEVKSYVPVDRVDTLPPISAPTAPTLPVGMPQQAAPAPAPAPVAQQVVSYPAPAPVAQQVAQWPAMGNEMPPNPIAAPTQPVAPIAAPSEPAPAPVAQQPAPTATVPPWIAAQQAAANKG